MLRATMFRATYWVGIALAGTTLLHAALPQSSDTSSAASSHRAVLSRYCVTCHNQKLKTAGLMLDQANVENPGLDAPAWEKVVRKLRTTSMPPAGMPRPDQSTYDSLAGYLETALDAAAASKPNPR